MGGLRSVPRGAQGVSGAPREGAAAGVAVAQSVSCAPGAPGAPGALQGGRPPRPPLLCVMSNGMILE